MFDGTESLIGTLLPLILFTHDQISYPQLVLFSIGILVLSSLNLNKIVTVLSVSIASAHILNLSIVPSLIYCTISLLSHHIFTSSRSIFSGSFKTGEVFLLCQFVSFWAVLCHFSNFTGWTSFFFLSSAVCTVWTQNRFARVSFLRLLTENISFYALIAGITLKPATFTDLFYMIAQEKGRLLIYWPVGLFFTVITPLLLPTLFSSQNAHRKFYHFAAVGLFVPAIFCSFGIVKIAFAFAALLLFTVEMSRVAAKKSKSSKIDEGLDAFMEKCRNDLDGGQLILSHLYLLLGCAIPVWFTTDHHNDVSVSIGRDLFISSFSYNNNKPDLASCSGIISLGVGDSLASIGGKAFGRVRWSKRSRKTVEGSLCGCIGMIFTWIVLQSQITKTSISSTDLVNFLLILISIGSSLCEALITDLNDNLTLPIFTFLLFKFSFSE